MSAKRKILFISTLALGLLTLMVVVLVTLSFRDYGIASAKEKSKLTAELVRDALTAHMINGVMDKREYFLDKITRSENVKKMWLVRAPSVEAQFGPSLYGESMRDAIDRKVLEEGKASEILKESAKEVTLRVTIPYIADSKGLPNCLSCHEAKEGEVLGAISMIFDIDSFRSTGLSTTLKILAAATALLLLTIYLVGRLITPYTELFEAFRKSLHHAQEGDFTHKVSTPLKDEVGELAKWLNSLTEKLHQVVSDIDRRISILIAYNKNQYNSNPLIRTKEIIGELADVYKFRRNIELLDKKEEVYDNITAIFLYKLNLKRFTIIQVQNGIEELIYPRDEEEAGSTLLQFNAQYVHAIPLYRDSANNVFSGYMPKENEYYINASFAISPSVLWQLSFAFDQYKEYERAKNLVSVIYNYLDAAKAILHTRMLMEMLKESSLRDPLTGLYNRKFLEEYIESATHQALRSKTTYAILMIDVDFFKMVNDTYGHDVGDQVISGLSNIIQNTIREADLAVRFGGEEFIVLLYNSAPEGAERVAQKIRSRFSEMVFEVNHERFSKTLSVGISMFPEDGPTVWRVIKFADIALYKAKESGRNQVVRFHSSMLPDGFNY